MSNLSTNVHGSLWVLSLFQWIEWPQMKNWRRCCIGTILPSSYLMSVGFPSVLGHTNGHAVVSNAYRDCLFVDDNHGLWIGLENLLVFSVTDESRRPDFTPGSEWDWISSPGHHQPWVQHQRASWHICRHGHAAGESGEMSSFFANFL